MFSLRRVRNIFVKKTFHHTLNGCFNVLYGEMYMVFIGPSCMYAAGLKHNYQVGVRG